MSLTISTSDNEAFVNVGGGDTWISLMSTVDVRLKKCSKKTVLNVF